MQTSKRVFNEPAWVLHHRPFRNTSRILDILSLEHGRLSLVARGARSSKSKLRGYLRPFTPLQLSWVMRTDLGTLTGAEMNGAPISLRGDALLSGYYVNELLLHLLHRHDPQPEIHAAYAATIAGLAGNRDIGATLRSFEMELLRLLGYALNLDHDTATREPLMPRQQYAYRAEQGPVPVSDREGEGPMVFTGAELMAIRNQQFADPAVLKNAGSLLRIVIAYHLDGKELKSRKVMREMRKATTKKGSKGN